MPTIDWHQRISINLSVCHGTVCIRGTRIPVSVVIDNLAAGVPHAEIFGSYPLLKEADLEAALRYAAALARDSVA